VVLLVLVGALVLLLLRDWLLADGARRLRAHPSVPWVGLAVLVVGAAQVVDLTTGFNPVATLVEELLELSGALALLCGSLAVLLAAAPARTPQPQAHAEAPATEVTPSDDSPEVTIDLRETRAVSRS